MRIVAALGGNALLERGQAPDAAVQVANVRAAAARLAELAQDHELVITHGNGPQVGVLALESADDQRLSEPYPFDTLGAQTQGMIGYWLLQAMQNALPGRQVASMVNQTLVLAGDPALEHPTKFVGEVYTRDEAQALAATRGWTVRPDGEHYRRVVGSPAPQRAVIDKDLTAAVLAEDLEADALLILTDVNGVYTHYGTPHAKQIPRATPTTLRALNPPAGSMGPKVEAVCRFVELTGDMAAIGRLHDATHIIQGTAGTIITPGGSYGQPNDLQPPQPAAGGPERA